MNFAPKDQRKWWDAQVEKSLYCRLYSIPSLGSFFLFLKPSIVIAKLGRYGLTAS
jgi:hypothetical protein